jgi:hypothetical protein
MVGMAGLSAGGEPKRKKCQALSYQRSSTWRLELHPKMGVVCILEPDFQGIMHETMTVIKG